MKQLTQEEAERCGKAYGWDSMTIMDTESFRDPYFWRPRLEDRLDELASRVLLESFDDNHGSRRYTVQTHEIGEGWEEAEDYFNPCPALCEAIEKLTKEGK